MTLAPLGDDCTADYARALTDRIKVAVEATWHLIAEAYQSRAWAALGYSSWDDYCTREFGTSRLRLPREDRQDVVQSLSDAGLSIRAIAAVTGDSKDTVARAISGVSFETPDEFEVDDEPVDESEPRRVTGTDGKSYPATSRAKAAAEWRGKPITPDLKDQIFGRGITANKRAEHFVSSTTRAVGYLVESGFSPDEMKAAAYPGDIERWSTDLRHAVKQINRYLHQLES